MRFLTALVLGLGLSACSSSSTAPSTSTAASNVVLWISPPDVTLVTGAVTRFSVLRDDTSPITSKAVINWSVAGTGCSGASCGTISATGTYTAPATAPTPPTVTVTAVLDSITSLTTTVTINPPESVSTDPLLITFGEQLVNTTSAPRVVTVTNTGSTPQPVFGGIGGQPGQWQDFASTNACPSMLAVGASCTFNITFTPHATGGRAAFLDVSGVFDDEAFVSLRGTGTN